MEVAEAWDELWNQLHHQGDVGEASYAAVPVLVAIQERTRSLGWNFFGLIATIEVERHRLGNPPMPEWLAESYQDAWRRVLQLALDEFVSTTDPETLRSALAVVVLAKGQVQLGAFLSFLDEDEVADLVEERLAWSDLYLGGPQLV